MLDKDGKVIVENQVTTNINTTNMDGAVDGGLYYTLSLPYEADTYNKYTKCKYIYVCFYSTVNSGKNMPFKETTQTIYVEGASNELIPYENNRAFIGSVLTIDDIQLIYDK